MNTDRLFHPFMINSLRYAILQRLIITIKHAYYVDHTILKNIYNKSLMEHEIVMSSFETLPDFVQVAPGARGRAWVSYSVAEIGSGSLCLMCLRLR